jgi:hypothetical protein
MKHENIVLRAIRATSLSLEDMEGLRESLHSMANQPYFITSSKPPQIFRNRRYIVSSSPILKKR